MDDYKQVVNALSRLIREARHGLEKERTEPGGNADASDSFMKNEQHRVKKLCELRDVFEDLECSSSVPPR